MTDLNQRLREIRKAAKREVAGDPLVFGLGGTVTVEPLAPLLTGALKESGTNAEVAVAPYGQIHQTCFDPASAFGVADLQAIAFVWRSEDLAASEIEEFLLGSDEALSRALDMVDEFVSALAHLAGSFGGQVYVGHPPFPEPLTVPRKNLQFGDRLNAFHAAVVTRWLQGVSNLPALNTFDLGALQRQFGGGATDIRKRLLYRNPYTEAFWLSVADDLVRRVALSRSSPKKCIVLDCDNTLWGGVVGEAGVDGIALGSDFPGSAFAEFQSQLKFLKEQGFMLALSSKNNEADVWEVFDKHDAMVLQREDIAAWRIDWNSKAENILEIAAELNILADSLVFIDDNPVEIEEVRTRAPEVATLTVPADAENIPTLVPGSTLFDRLEVTGEDRQRTKMMLVEKERSTASASLSKEEFLASLDLKVTLFEAGEAHLGRVTQLVNKTNQFNLTTVRRDADQIRALHDDDGWSVFAIDVADKFGDYGLVGVALVDRTNAASASVDTFLMSCRVLGKAVETAFLHGIAEALSATGVEELVADYVPTAKNKPVEDLLPSHGFAKDEDGRYRCTVSDLRAKPDHIDYRFAGNA